MKLWVGGQLILDTQARLDRARVLLEGAHKHAVKLECAFERGAAAVALCWDSPARDRHHLQRQFLYPADAAVQPDTADMPMQPGDKPRGKGLIAHFMFDEGEGFRARSQVGAAILGTLTGGTVWSQGKVGGGVTFTVTKPFDFALLPIKHEIRMPATDYTVAFWFKSTSPNARLFCVGRNSCYNNIWTDHVISLDGGRLRIDVSGDQPLNSAGKLNDGQWHHVASTIGGEVGPQKLYVDGKLEATGKSTARQRTSNRLGVDLGPGRRQCELTIDDLRVYGKALLQNETEAVFREHLR